MFDAPLCVINEMALYEWQLGDAVESRSLPLTQARSSDTAGALREVVAVLAPSLQSEPRDPDE